MKATAIDEHDLKVQRQAAIRALLEEDELTSQQEIVARLARRGVRTTQSVVSRDLRELEVGKVGGRYRLLDAEAPAALPDAVHSFILQQAPAGPHLLVVRTVVGGATPVAIAIDRAGWHGVVGTIAGDDTVFLATADERAQRQARRWLRRFMQRRRERPRQVEVER